MDENYLTHVFITFPITCALVINLIIMINVLRILALKREKTKDNTTSVRVRNSKNGYQMDGNSGISSGGVKEGVGENTTFEIKTLIKLFNLKIQKSCFHPPLFKQNTGGG